MIRTPASAAVVVAAVVLLSGCAHDSTPSGAGAEQLTVDLGKCGSAWTAPGGGVISLEITNDFRDAMDVQLVGASADVVYGELEGMGARTTQTLTATLGNGSYRLLCFPNDNPYTYGPTVTISGADGVKDPTPGIVPVSSADLIPIAKSYQAWVVGRLPTLETQVQALQQDLVAGRSAQAKIDWLTAHMTYETLGAAYGAFGDLDTEINGAPTAGVEPARDGHLTGFHKVEALLWSGAPQSATVSATSALAEAVRELADRLAHSDIEPNIIALRAHEIVENAIQFELTGTTDSGSHSNLATVSANLTGAAKTLALLTPLLTNRYAALPQAEQSLAATQLLVATFDKDGAWTPLHDLTRTQREHVDAAMEQLVELLAPVAAICDVRQVP